MSLGASIDCMCRDWRVAYNALLNVYAKSGQASAAEAVYQAMLINGPRPDSISVNTTIAAHAQVWLPHWRIVCMLEFFM